MSFVTRDGFDTFYATYHKAIQRYLYHLLGDPELAADLAQEAFCHAFKALQKGNITASQPWIYQIAKNCAIDVLRCRKIIAWSTFSDLAVASALEDDELIEFADDGVDVQFADAIATRSAIYQVLEQLDPKEQACLWIGLHASCVTGARALGISIAAYKMRLMRARAHFITLWQQEIAA